MLSELGQGASARQTLGLGRDGSAIGQARHIPSRYARVPVWQGRHTRDLPEHSRRSVQMTRYVLLEAVKRCERRPAPARQPSLNFGTSILAPSPGDIQGQIAQSSPVAIRFPLRRNRFHAALATARAACLHRLIPQSLGETFKIFRRPLRLIKRREPKRRQLHAPTRRLPGR